MTVSEAVVKLQEAIDGLQETVEKSISQSVSTNDTEFLKSISREYVQNKFFTLSYLQGLAKPESGYISKRLGEVCFHKTEGEGFPHLRHTFNPQLNVIVDMLEELLECSCCPC